MDFSQTLSLDADGVRDRAIELKIWTSMAGEMPIHV